MDKPFHLKFVGGSLDGQTFRTDSPDPEESYQAKGWHLMTQGGKLGGCIVHATPYSIQRIREEVGQGKPIEEVKGSLPDYYQINERNEDDKCVSATLTYIGKELANKKEYL
jgi:hypothetical protein